MSELTPVDAQLSEDERALFSKNLAEQASLEVEQEVPNWHRAQAFEQHFSTDEHKHKKLINWGVWLGVPALSMACSAFAITVVMNFMPGQTFNKQVVAQQVLSQGVTALIDEQVKLKVAAELASQSDTDIEALLNLKLREFAAEQQVMLANYRADLSTQQQSSNLALASYVIGASRKERKEDMSDFISFINAQRKDEQLSQKIKFQQLEREIGFQQLSLKQIGNIEHNSATPINYKG
ncbi:hypothetical protein [Colwellia piezophila]|uniref:hypothetical protein n=1 Tax=Colwellia piezophila TaxID=211668 RepID=UPI0003810582|nr:hypothetical protein [Colwellia piezophila]